jgi:hypothetical protein
VTTRETTLGAPPDRLPRPDDGRDGRGRAAGWLESSTVPFEQIGQSAVKRLWRQKRLFTDIAE